MPITTSFAINPLNGNAFICKVVNNDSNSERTAPMQKVRRSAVFGGASALLRSPACFNVYDRFNDCFAIPPLQYSTPRARDMTLMTDEYIRYRMSTSPLAEDDSFPDETRQSLLYLREHPNWREAFPNIDKSRRFHKKTFSEIE